MSDVHCPARIILARHGEAEYESDLVGTSGGSLTARGRSQAVELGDRLVSERVAAVFCSELARAVQTAELAAARLGLPVTVRERLDEFDGGDARGGPYDAAVFEPPLEAWLGGDLTVGFPGGESGADVVARVLAVLDAVADTFRGETVLVVSHGGVILALLGALSPGAPGNPAGADDVPNGASCVLERDADGWRAG